MWLHLLNASSNPVTTHSDLDNPQNIREGTTCNMEVFSAILKRIVLTPSHECQCTVVVRWTEYLPLWLPYSISLSYQSKPLITTTPWLRDITNSLCVHCIHSCTNLCAPCHWEHAAADSTHIKPLSPPILNCCIARCSPQILLYVYINYAILICIQDLNIKNVKGCHAMQTR